MFERKFGCTVAKDYKECFIIDDHACLRLTPAGFLKNDNIYSPFGHIYSQHRLAEPYRELLMKEIRQDFRKEIKLSYVTTPAKKIADYFFKILSTQIPENYSAAILALLETIFDTATSITIIKQLKFDNTFINKNFHTTLQNLLQREIKRCLRHNKLPELKPTKEFSQDQIRIIQQLETHLTEKELEILQQRKVRIIASIEIAKDPEVRGSYQPLSNTIYIKKDNIEHSLIHEVQHSLGTDLSLVHPQQYIKFLSHCKNARLEMKDMKHVITLSDQDSNDITEHMLTRAKYILSLYNYDCFQRTGEIMGHLRQFIADIGEEKVKLILPNLFAFWQKEVLPQSITSSLKQG